MTYTKPCWNRTAQQFSQLIGYKLNRSGIRVRRRFYFGTDKARAIAESKHTQIEWRRLVEDHHRREDAARMMNPASQRTLPAWANESIMPIEVKADLTNVSIQGAAKLFLDAKKAQVGLAGGKGIKPVTFNSITYSLTVALGLSMAKHKPLVTRRPIDIDKPLTSLTKSALEKYVQFWMALPGGIATRTAISYCATFKQFLDWCDAEPAFNFTKPKGTDGLFNFRGMKKPRVEKYDPAQLKALLAEAHKQSPKTLLYCLLALQCGMYTADIGWLLQSDLTMIDGEAYLYRSRSKLTGVQGDGQQHVLQWLFPETAALIEQYRAPKENPHQRLILNSHGSPLWEEQVGKYRRDTIKPAYQRVCQVSGIKLHFRQLRKITWNAMKRIMGTDDGARKWAGQSVQGISRWYNLDEFGDVTKALKQWRDELIAAGVLPTLALGRVAA